MTERRKCQFRYGLYARKLVPMPKAEIFGGMGAQANAIIERNGDVSGPVIAVDAINSALRCLGVKPIKGQDELDAVGLGKHRDTDNWLPKHSSL